MGVHVFLPAKLMLYITLYIYFHSLHWFQVSLETLKPFSAFAQHFSANSFAILITYREGIFLSLQVCVCVNCPDDKRVCGIKFPPADDRSTNLNLKVFMCVCIYQEAAVRCEKQFSAGLEDRDELLKQMLDWAFGGFQRTGPDRLKTKAATNGRNMNTFTRYFQTDGAIKRSVISCRKASWTDQPRGTKQIHISNFV